MQERPNSPDDAQELRLRADRIARENTAAMAGQLESMSPEDMRRTLHELHVHQIELEMQNEELRRTQVELAASKASYVDLYDFAPVGYLTVSGKGLIVKANLPAADMLGVGRSTLLGARFSQFILPEDQDIYYLQRKSLSTSNKPLSCELRLLRDDARRFWVRLESTAAPDAEGLPGARIAISDVTAEKQQEEALERTQAELKAIYDHTPILLCQLDEDRRILFANPAFLAFTATSAAVPAFGTFGEVLGCIHAGDNPRGCGYGDKCGSCSLRLTVNSAITSGVELKNIEHQTIVLRNGKLVEATLLLTTAHMPSAGKPRLLLCLHDITALKQAEREREKLQAQLVQAQKMESIGRLAGGIAHDFNNLLTVINGYASLSLQRIGPLETHFRHFTEILHAGERSAELVHQLLAFSRKQVLRPEVMNVNGTLQGMHRMLERLVGDDIEIVTDLESGLPLIHADKHQVEQVMMNLAANARDAMPDGGTLTLGTRSRRIDSAGSEQGQPEMQPGDYVDIFARDTGTGMDATTLEHLFEPFFTTKGVGKGTGLGLSTVQGIAIQSGGGVEVASEPGKGSCFHVLFPVEKCEETAPDPVALAMAMGGTETILLVEDEPQVRQFLAMTLQEYGYKVMEAAQAGEALTQYANSSFDLLVTDVMMPQMSGVELAKRMTDIRPDLKVLLISGYSREIHQGTWAVPEGGHFLQKPFGIAELAAKARQILDGVAVAAVE